MDGTPIYDIKPYLAYTDSHPDARGGFTDPCQKQKLKVHFRAGDPGRGFSSEERMAISNLLAADPRPAYQDVKTESMVWHMHSMNFVFFVRGRI